MQKQVLVGILLLLPTLVHAERISYTLISKAMLDTETLRSPVYTKSFYRDMRQEDTAAYTAQKERLRQMKEKGTLSAQSYSQQISALDKAYMAAYGQEGVVQQGAAITQNPVGSFYNEVMNNNARVQLQLLTNVDTINRLSELPAVDTSAQPVRPITTQAPAPEGRRGLENVTRMRAPQGSMAAETKTMQAEQQTSPIPTRKKALGEKSLPLNLDAFK